MPGGYAGSVIGDIKESVSNCYYNINYAENVEDTIGKGTASKNVFGLTTE